MKKLLLLLTAGILVFSASAQQTPVTKSNYSLAERFSPKNIEKLVHSQNVNPHFLKKSDRFWFEYKTTEGKNWYIVDAIKGSKSELFDLGKLAAAATLIVKDPLDRQHLPITNVKFADDEQNVILTFKSTIDIDTVNIETGKKEKVKKDFFINYNLLNGSITEFKGYKAPKDYPSWASVSPDGETILFSRDFNLYYMDRANFEKALRNEKDSTIVEHKITTDGVENYGYGEDNDYKSNVSIEKNKDKRKTAYAIWSPDSRSFAVARTDKRLVKSLWVINAVDKDSPRPTLESYKYHMPGEKEAPQQYLYVFDNATKTGKKVDFYAYKDQTFGIASRPMLKSDGDNIYNPRVWAGGNDKFYITRTSRDLKRISVCLVDVKTGSVKQIYEDTLNKSLETREPKVVEGTNEFVAWSERDGWGHLYLYDNNGNMKNRITDGEFHVEEVVGIDPATRTVYFTAMGREKGENPYYQHLYRASLNGGGIKLLSNINYNNSPVLSDSKKYFINNFSRVDTTPESWVIDNNGKKISGIAVCDLSQLFKAGYKFPERFVVKADDGITDLYGVLYKPFDFDSTKLYPVVNYVYPGPHTEAVNTAFSSRMDRVDRLAQLGFIVVTVGNRGGHPNRSKWYHTYSYGNLRDYGLADKKYANKQLAAERPYMDINKVGITGHSGGGFMSTAAILKYPEFFKVAVSCAGNHENNIYNRWWSEKHHGVKEEVSDKGDTTFVYSIAKNSEIANNLKGRLMLVTGDIDNNVHPANTYRVVDALIRSGKRFDMMVLPGQRHGFGDMTEYYFWLMADYFSEHLIGDSEKSVDIVQMK